MVLQCPFDLSQRMRKQKEKRRFFKIPKLQSPNQGSLMMEFFLLSLENVYMIPIKVIRGVWHRLRQGKMNWKILYLFFFVVFACCTAVTAAGDHSGGQMTIQTRNSAIRTALRILTRSTSKRSDKIFIIICFWAFNRETFRNWMILLYSFLSSHSYVVYICSEENGNTGESSIAGIIGKMFKESGIRGVIVNSRIITIIRKKFRR